MRVTAFDRRPESQTLPKDVPLPNQLIQGPRPHTHGKRRIRPSSHFGTGFSIARIKQSFSHCG
jgi:ribosomal protein L13E